jgi:hypothetical protein
MRRCSFVAVFVFSAAVAANHAHAQSAPSWDRLRMLLGTWESAGDTQLGQGLGTASFSAELNGQIIVRRSFAEYTSGPQAGTRHDDLLVIYREAPDAPPKAIYFDSEGHVIRYSIATPTERSVVFQSDSSAPGPRYRLSYARAENALDGTFEIAMPGADYKTYLSWTSSKR